MPFRWSTTLWDRREALHQSRMADMATGPVLQDTLSTLQGAGLSELAGKAALTRGMEGQAYLLASIDVFHLSMWNLPGAGWPGVGSAVAPGKPAVAD